MQGKNNMNMTLICKKKEHNNSKWTNYNYIKNGVWYSVRFVKGCQTPRPVTIDEGIQRAFISLTNKNTFNIVDTDFGKVIYVEDYDEVPSRDIEKLKQIEVEKIEAYRQKREDEKISFLSNDEEDLPF